MKKTYIKPTTVCIEMTENVMLTPTSGPGVATGQSLGDEFNGGDISYSKTYNEKTLWERDW